jgi:signal transduction histidine kinase
LSGSGVRNVTDVGGRDVPMGPGDARRTNPLRVRAALTAAFVVTALALASAAVVPLVAISSELRGLIALGDDHAAAVDVLAMLRGELSDIRMTLVRSAAGTETPTDAAAARAFGRLTQAAASLERFADTSFEKKGIRELRDAISRSATLSQRVRAASRRGRSEAVAELPAALAVLADADAIAQRLVTFNASQVQQSARSMRGSLWRVGELLALLGAFGLAAALFLLLHARAGFAAYSASIEARAAEMAAFAGRAAHELRTPLQSVTLALTILRRSPQDPKALGRADAGVIRLRTTIDKLLAFAAAGGTPGDHAVCDVAPVVEEVVAELSGPEGSPGVDVRKEVDPSLSVGMDASHLGAVISNLVGNAAKYGRTASGVHVQISAVRRGPGWAEITVADDGPGIPPHAVPHVFEPLYRASSTPGGYGLGLATTKRLVEAHGGNIAVDSAVVRGTTIRVRLPVGDAAPRE